MRRESRSGRSILLWLGLALLAAPQPSRAGDVYKPFKLLAQPFEAKHREKPVTGQDCSIEQLADQIDWLEHHIDTYGSIVAKHPDVWGESRLMRHRYEYEEQMAAQLGQFEVRMNAALRRSDQSFLGMAFALQAAAGTAPDGTPVQIPDASKTGTYLTNLNAMIPTTSENPANSAAVIFRSEPFAAVKDPAVPGFSYENDELSLEPTIQLDQMSRYLNHLHELRRINEGDDIADSPGYALNLVRIPISVLPGKQTRKGYGAEITITAEPYLSDDLLPTTFRNLVINDLVDQLAYPMTRVVNSLDGNVKEKLRRIANHHFLVNTQPGLRDLPAEKAWEEFQGAEDLLLKVLLAKVILSADEADLRKIPELAADSDVSVTGTNLAFSLAGESSTVGAPSELKEMIQLGYGGSQREPILEWRSPTAGAVDSTTPRELQTVRPFSVSPDAKVAPGAPKDAAKAYAYNMGVELGKARDDLLKVFAQLQNDFATDISFAVPVTRSRRARMPIAPSQLLSAYDLALVAHVAADTYAGLENSPIDKNGMHLMDVQGCLLEEAAKAYDFLTSENKLYLWTYCGPNVSKGGLSLADALRTCNQREIEDIRNKFLGQIGVSPSTEGLADGDTTRSLAWMILVHASLLNDQLIQDIREATAAKGCSACFATPEGLDFYNPQPSDTAVAAFNEYVKCRWPIRVFALDPVTEDQNVADEFARRRELQVAAALAFASGQINAQALMRFTRRLEWDMATIALNRTVVAFSHGNDTFGWRFQPRFQTPPTPGTLKAFGETLLGGPTRDADMRQRELESGIRECTAIVVMPSFVPYATFDVRTNWYKLTNPKCTEISMRETMELSRAITAMKNSAAQCARCAHLYREGEVDRLLRRVDQLDRELPLQTMMVQIPYENTSGGFEIFNRGITELTPELIGWYGAPGINLHDATTMFLVGDGFSVHDTRVIAGGQPIAFQLISRQLMQVEIPTGLQVLTRGRSEPSGKVDPEEPQDVVDVHLATPYGVSSHLLVPVAAAKTVRERVKFEMCSGAVLTLTYTKSGTPPTRTFDKFFRFKPDALVIRVPHAAELTDSATITFSLHDARARTFLGQFPLSSTALSKGSLEYRLSETNLSEMATQIQKLAEPYLQYLRNVDTISVRVTAEMPNKTPVEGHFIAVICERK
ncbi:MAG: hypothetical protein GXX96_10830 [Planctomycetaceae bacterium]|nr:hypothetical protein [Planctomycetaceae bacterium]